MDGVSLTVDAKEELRDLAHLSVGLQVWAGSDSATEIEAKQRVLRRRIGDLPWRTAHVTEHSGRPFR
jgi:hypothetical protein